MFVSCLQKHCLFSPKNILSSLTDNFTIFKSIIIRGRTDVPFIVLTDCIAFPLAHLADNFEKSAFVKENFGYSFVSLS